MITIPKKVYDTMIQHAKSGYPNEACGILAGTVADGRATAYHPARNADASPFVYTVHPDDLVRIVLGIEDAGQDLVAIFHSHTRSPAIPSPTDRRQAMYPEAFYLLASLVDPDVMPMQALRAWRIRDGDATEAPLRIE